MSEAKRIDRFSLAFSAGVHLVVLVAAWLSAKTTRPQVEFVIPDVELVSPAPMELAEVEQDAAEEIVTETPAAEPAEALEPEPEPVVEPEPEPVVEPEPEPMVEDEPEPDEPDPVDEAEAPEPEVPEREPELTADVSEPVEVADETTEATTTEEADAEETGEDINARLEGVRREYPEYYENIIRQINRCFRRPAEGRWETTVAFAILKDGSVTDARFLARSGNTDFDFQALRAVVDCAGKGRFGPLPEGLPYERLPVAFDFRPSGDARPQGPTADPILSVFP